MKSRAITAGIVTAILILGAVLTPVASASAAEQSGATAHTAAKKKKKCKKKAKKGAAAAEKSKCKKKSQSQDPTIPGGDGPPPPGVLAPLTCPTGTVSGANPVTVSGNATSAPGAPVIVYYRTWNGAAFQDHQTSTTANASTGAWSFSFTPNTGPWNPAWPAWQERVSALYAGDSASCTFNVGA